ncbi:MAG: carboxymuconolactone decarboxylase family protein, partial [Usitatibacter sp.]
MPRIPYCDENDPQIGDLVDSIKARRKGKLINLDRMLLHSPPFAQGWNALLGAVRRSLEISPRVRELAICAVARLNDAPYEWYQHAPEFLAAGGAQSQLDALDDVDAASRDAVRFDEAERAALQLTLEMTQGVQVSDATLARARAGFGDRRLTEL